MLSIIFASRVFGNEDSQIKKLLDSTIKCTDKEDYNKIEFLIKYDHDDLHRPHDKFFSHYPFPIKTFTYARGEGRHYNHHHCEYLFANRNPSFKWIMNMSDDFIFTRKGFLKDLEIIKDKYMIVGHTNPTFSKNTEVYRKHHPINFEENNGIGAYCPLITADLVNVCQNMGWQPNLDAWIVLLEVTLYRKYGFCLWNKIDQFYERTGGYGDSGDTPTYPSKEIYNNMTITGKKLPQNHYIFNLIEAQAKNIYLNMVDDGIDISKYKI